MKRTMIAFVVVCAAVCAQAQSAPQTTVAPDKAEKIRQLVRVTGVADVAINMMKNLMSTQKRLIPIPEKAQDDFANAFFAAFTKDEFIELIVPVYDKHFSDSDLDQMNAFYRSPVGQKAIKELPAISEESQAVGQKWGAELGTKIGAPIIERVKAGDYGPWPPPSKDSGQKPTDPPAQK